MPEKFDSIGNQALKSFRHYIDPARHIWLRVPPKFEVDAGQSEHRTRLVSETDDEAQKHSTNVNARIEEDIKSLDHIRSHESVSVVDSPTTSPSKRINTATQNPSHEALRGQSTSADYDEDDVIQDSVMNPDGAVT
jgi:hypothetical protein